MCKGCWQPSCQLLASLNLDSMSAQLSSSSTAAVAYTYTWPDTVWLSLCPGCGLCCSVPGPDTNIMFYDSLVLQATKLTVTWCCRQRSWQSLA